MWTRNLNYRVSRHSYGAREQLLTADMKAGSDECKLSCIWELLLLFFPLTYLFNHFKMYVDT